MHERAPQNDMYFQILKYICIHIQSMQWYGTLNDSMTNKTLTLRDFHIKNAISFNILLLLQKLRRYK